MAKLAIYTFNSDTDTLPTLNDGFATTEIDLGTVYAEETINIGVIGPNAKLSLIIDGFERPLENGTASDNYIRYMPTLGLYFYHYIDGTESRIETSDDPPLYIGISIQIIIKDIVYIDVDNGNSTITRTIFGDSSPSSISFSGKTGLVSLSYLDTSNVTDMSNMFSDCNNLTSLDASSWNTSKVTDMSRMFAGCTNLASIDLSSFDTSNVTDINQMFNGCSNLTSVDLSSFDTSNVINMYIMFSYCYNLTSLDISNFNTNKVTIMRDMFVSCDNLTTINMNNSDVDSINDIISQLPTRTVDSPGTMIVSKNVLSSVDTTTANSEYWNIIKPPEYSFTMNTLKYLLTKLKEKFVLKSEGDLKVDKVAGKDLVTNDYTDSYAQMNQNALNNLSISSKTDTEIQLAFKSNNGNNIITIPYDKHRKSVLFVDCEENFDCYENSEYEINYRYVSAIKEGVHKLTVEILRNNEVIKNETDIADHYLYVPNLNDTEIRMYATDPEGTKTGITYLKPNVKPEPIVTYATTNTAMRPKITGLNSGYTAEINGNKVELFKNNSSDVVTYINFYNTNSLTNVSYMTSSINNMYSAYSNCSNLTGSPVCGPNVTDMYSAYSNCTNLTGSPVCGPNVTDMYYTYRDCTNLTGSPVCGKNVTDMTGTYQNCKNLTGNPVCEDNVTNMAHAYQNCYNLTGSPVCGLNVTNMYMTYSGCAKLTGSPVCGDKVTDMSYTYYKCNNLTGSPVCEPNVTNMKNTYSFCTNLTGSPACGDKVTDMYHTYTECSNLTGSPVCGDNVTSMKMTYDNCTNLTGSPVCGDKVTTMYYTYRNCRNLTGSPICGNNVIYMTYAYRNCTNLTGSPVCGPNVTNMWSTYSNCPNLYGDMIVYSNNVSNATDCFYGRNASRRLNIICEGHNQGLGTVPPISYNTFTTQSIVGSKPTWTEGTSDKTSYNRMVYNSTYNIYVYWNYSSLSSGGSS